MRITFTMPDSTAALLLAAAARMKLETPGRAMSPHKIAKALVHEVLIDDASEYGYVPNGCHRRH